MIRRTKSRKKINQLTAVFTIAAFLSTQILPSGFADTVLTIENTNPPAKEAESVMRNVEGGSEERILSAQESSSIDFLQNDSPLSPADESSVPESQTLSSISFPPELLHLDPESFAASGEQSIGVRSLHLT